MKLGTKITIIIIAAFTVNAVVTVLFTMPDTNPALSLTVIPVVHILTLSAAIISVRFIITKPLKKLIDNIKGYRSGNRMNRVQRNDEIGELHNSFANLTNQLDEEKSAQNRIIASISHDIKTPLTSVMGYTEFLKNPNLPDARREKYINTIYTKALEIQDTVLGFDDYLSHNLDLNLKREFMTVEELLSFASESIKTDTVNSGASVSYAIDGCNSDQIYADKARLRRVFTNVAGNSLRHADKSGLEITLSAARRGEEIVVKITDNGCGVKPDQLEKIFEPLYTTDTSRSVAGLGLSICREIIGSHGGSIWAESEYGKYFSVCFTLPVVTSEKKPD